MTEALDDQITAALEAEADRALDDPGGWPAIERRIGRARRTRRALAVVAAAAACVAAVAVVGSSLGEEDSGEVEIIDEPDAPAPPDSGPDPIGDQPGPAARRTTPPPTLVAVTEDGRLVVVDTATGQEIRQLAAYDDPRTDDATEGGQPLSISSVALSPDGQTVWFDTCCEPAGGALYRVPIDGSTPPEHWTAAYAPEFASSDGWFATVGALGVTLNFPAGDFGRFWQGSFEAGLQEVAWSLDGRHVVLRDGTETGRLLVLDPSQMGDVEAADVIEYDHQEPTVVLGRQWKLPVFDRDGGLVVASRSESGAWTGQRLDIDNLPNLDGSVFPYDGEPLDQDYDASGEWLLVVVQKPGDSAGTLQWRSPGGDVPEISGHYYAAAW